MLHRIIYENAIGGLSEFDLKHTYANNLEAFSGEKLNELLSYKHGNDLVGGNSTDNDTNVLYDEIIELYLKDKMALGSVASEQEHVTSIRYSQTVFPTSENIYSKFTRLRLGYEEVQGIHSNGFDRIDHRSFWRNNFQDRQRSFTRENTSLNARNSQGIIQDQRAIGGPCFSTMGTSSVSYALLGWGNYYVNDCFYRPQGFQPWSFASPSMWPMDSRPDSGADYLASGIGMTPNSPSEKVTATLPQDMGFGLASAKAFGYDPFSTMTYSIYSATLKPWEWHKNVDNKIYGKRTIWDSLKVWYSQSNINDGIWSTDLQFSQSVFIADLTFSRTSSLHAPSEGAGELTYNTAPTIYYCAADHPLDGAENNYQLPLTLSMASGMVGSDTISIYNKTNWAGGVAEGARVMGGRQVHTASVSPPHEYLGGSAFRDEQYSNHNGGNGRGYTEATSSMLYQLHNYPYRQAWYVTDKITGKGPFFDNYMAWTADLKPLAQDYSILPEFKISDHMEYYHGNDFDSECVTVEDTGYYAEKWNRAFLTMKGGVVTASANRNMDGTNNNLFDPQSKIFYKTYSNSDFLRHFDVVREDHKDEYVRSSMKVTCHAIKKLLPYYGFYPQTRAMQLGQLFSQSIGPHLTMFDSASVPVRAREAGKMQAMLEPFYAPGIFFNSIKSGIAVDWPMYTGSVPQVSGSRPWFSNTAMGNETIIVTETEYGGNGTPPVSAPFSLSGTFDYRLPFEAIMDPARYLPLSASDGSGHVYLPNLYRHFTSSKPVTNAGSCNYQVNSALNRSQTTKMPLYKMAAHNFFATVPDFFLQTTREGGGFTTIHSSPTPKAMYSGSVYYMDVVLRMGIDHVQLEGPRQGAMTKERNLWRPSVGAFGTGLTSEDMDTPRTLAQSPNPSTVGVLTQYNYLRTVGMTGTFMGDLRGQPYGHATQVMDGKEVSPGGVRQEGVTNGKLLGRAVKDPAYAPYTPPYFYGEARWRMKFTPTNHAAKPDGYNGGINEWFYKTGELATKTNPDGSTEYVTSSNGSPVEVYRSKLYHHFSVRDILEGCHVESFSVDYYEKYPNDTAISGGLCRFVPELNSVAAKNRMKLNSSINLWNLVRVKDTEKVSSGGNKRFGYVTQKQFKSTVVDPGVGARWVWAIEPKWECPVLDFSGTYSVTPTDNPEDLSAPAGFKVYQNKYHDPVTGRGMWCGYGTDPYSPFEMSWAHVINQNILTASTGGKIVINQIKPPVGTEELGILQQDKGIWLSLEESYPEKIIKMPENADRDEFEAVYMSAGAAIGYSTQPLDENGDPTGEPVHHGPNKWTGYTGSLVDVLRFDPTPRPIGRVANRHTFSEAVVAIPYSPKPISFNGTFGEIGTVPCPYEPGKHFFSIPPQLFAQIKNKVDQGLEPNPNQVGSKNESAPQLTNTSIADMIKKMDKFVMPPHLDFSHSPDRIHPFVMYIFDFEHTLSKKELMDIWQGSMPKSCNKIIKTSKTIEHPMNQAYDFFTFPLQPEGILPAGTSDGIRWMVFKVKQRANYNYNLLTINHEDDDDMLKSLQEGEEQSLASDQNRNMPRYSFNWPYDYFSLVEMAKVDVDLELSKQ